MADFHTGRAWIELDMGALAHNVSRLRSLLPAGCRLMPAVKANAYGHGAALISRELNRLGVDSFCVASAGEGAALREAGVYGDILVLGYTHPKDMALLRENNLIQTIVDGEYARLLPAAGPGLRTHLAIDSGMHRLGIGWGDTALMEQVCRMSGFSVEGAYTHLCTDDRNFSLLQARRFYAAVAALRREGHPLPRAHILSSAGLFDLPGLGGAYARTGIALYGLMSRREEERKRNPGLMPVLSLKARVASVREIAPGEGAGYGLAFHPGRKSRLAALSIGYADGLPSSASGGQVLIRGRSAPIVGRLCMDQSLVDVTALPAVQPGDEAVLIGVSEGARISAYALAEKCGCITNELLSRLGPRLERVPV